MNEKDYHQIADKTLSGLYDALESLDREGALEVEYEDGALTIKLPSGKQWLISKHGVTKQLWLASPISGGLHFVYDGTWALPDGRTLPGVLAEELRMVAKVKIGF